MRGARWKECVKFIPWVCENKVGNVHKQREREQHRNTDSKQTEQGLQYLETCCLIMLHIDYIQYLLQCCAT